MTSKRTNKNRQDSFNSQFAGTKSSLDAYRQKIRVIQTNLVCVNGLPSQIANKKTLKGEKYFGRYGRVKKIIINSPQSYKKNATSQVYVTYQKQLQAAITIVALDGFKIIEKPLKVSYGTTKYCSTFLKGNQCENSECFYLHQLDKEHQILQDNKNQYSEQNNNAIDLVIKNLEYLLRQEMKQNKSIQQDDTFPTYSQIIDFLIDTNIISESHVEYLYGQIEQQNANQEMKSQQTTNDTLRQQQNLLTSPITQKGSDKDISQQNISLENSQNSQLVIKLQQMEILKKLDDKIQKLLMKEILKNNSKECRSRFNFVHDSCKKSIDEECDKIKYIVKQVLIANS